MKYYNRQIILYTIPSKLVLNNIFKSLTTVSATEQETDRSLTTFEINLEIASRCSESGKEKQASSS